VRDRSQEADDPEVCCRRYRAREAVTSTVPRFGPHTQGRVEGEAAVVGDRPRICAGQAEVSFNAARFVRDLVLLPVPRDEYPPCGPRRRPHVGSSMVDVSERGRSGTHPPFNKVEVPGKSTLALKFVTSSSSVKRSQRPRGAPHHRRICAGRCGPPSRTTLRGTAIAIRRDVASCTLASSRNNEGRVLHLASRAKPGMMHLEMTGDGSRHFQRMGNAHPNRSALFCSSDGPISSVPGMTRWRVTRSAPATAAVRWAPRSNGRAHRRRRWQ
jgi:hypothetical protein